jgi:transcriptional regulator GlxA family with amidase domain
MAPINVVFLVLPHIHQLDMSGPDQVFHEAKDYGTSIDIQYCSYEKNIVTSTGLPLGELKDYRTIEFQKGDYLIIPGAEVSYLLSSAFLSKKELFEWLKMAHQQGVNLCSVCTGAYVLGIVGLLNHRKCTTHWKHTQKLQELFPKAKVVENILFTDEGGIYSSAGVTSGIDLALHIVSNIKDDFTAYKVARELVVYNRRKGTDAQQNTELDHRNHIHSGIHKVQDWLSEHLHQKANLNELADIACMSSRNLTRMFKKETGISVLDYVTLLRKNKINQLLQNPDLSRIQIAQLCGLKSERHLTRLITN